jgi:hypothetical protein
MPGRPRRPSDRPTPLRTAMGCLTTLVLVSILPLGIFYVYFLSDARPGGPMERGVAPLAGAARNAPVAADARPADVPAAGVPPAAGVAPPVAAAGPDEERDIERAAAASGATATSVLQQQLVDGKARQRRAIATYVEVKRALDEWADELAAWQNTGPPLLTSDAGKRIAADATLTRRFRAVFDQERPTSEQLAVARAAASDLISPIQEALSNPDDASLPNEVIVKALREIQGQVRKARDELRTATEQVRAMLAQAGPGAGPKTLEEVITAQALKDAEARTTLNLAEVKKGEEDGTRQIAEEKAKAALAAKKREAESIRAEDEKQAQAARMALLRQKARSPDVRRYLGPFLASGFSQPKTGGSHGVIFDRFGDEGPMSLSRIRNAGGLDKGERGLMTLHRIASSQYNDRTVKWNFGLFLSEFSPDSMRFIKTAQDLLIELGDALVEEGMLAK